MNEPAWEPEWQPQFKAYNHVFGVPELIYGNSDIKGWTIKCPCGQKFYMLSENMRDEWNNSAVVMICVNPDCKAWHSVLFKIPQPPRESPMKMTAKF